MITLFIFEFLEISLPTIFKHNIPLLLFLKVIDIPNDIFVLDSLEQVYLVLHDNFILISAMDYISGHFSHFLYGNCFVGF